MNDTLTFSADIRLKNHRSVIRNHVKIYTYVKMIVKTPCFFQKTAYTNHILRLATFIQTCVFVQRDHTKISNKNGENF